MSLETLASVHGDFSERVAIATGLNLENFFQRIHTKKSLKIIQFSIHNICQQLCGHCFQMESEPREVGETDLVDKCFSWNIKNDIKKYPFPREPLLLPKFLPVYKHMECTEISTTGLQIYLNPGLIQLLKDNLISTVFISLHGNAKQHSILTGMPLKDYDKILSAIYLLNRSGINVEVITTLYKHNIDSLEMLPNKLIQLGVSKWWLQRIMPAGRALSWRLSDFIIGKECNKVMERFAVLRREYKPDQLHIGLDLTWGPNFYSSNMLKFLCGQERKWPWSKFVCPSVSGDSSVISFETGDIYPCLFFETFPEAKIGNRKEKEINQIFSEKTLVGNLEGQCRDCTYKIYCLGGCRALAYTFAKFRKFPNPFFAGQDYCLSRAIDLEFGNNHNNFSSK